MTAPVVDPYTPQFQRDPYPGYASLRAHSPVYRVPGRELYLVVTAELLRQVLRDPATFSNAVTSGRRALPPPEVAAQVDAVRARGHSYESALGLSDAPRHTRFRKLVQRAFTPRSLTWMDPVAVRIARELVDAMAVGRPVEIVEALARPLPIYAICRILGLPDAWRTDIARWSDAATASLGSGALEPQRFLEIEHEMLDFQRALVPEFVRRRAEPRDDLLSTLVAPDREFAALTDSELIWLVRELLVAGNETTTKLITDLVLRLDTHPQEWAQLRAEPDRAAALVEEGLRIASPVQGLFRRVTRATSLGGVALEEGDTVFLAFASANRDEAVFADPDTFDPDRHNARQHLAFGQGIHTCLGAALSRMEGAIALRELARRFDRVAVIDPLAVRYTPSFVLRGILDLPVRVTPRADGAAR